MISQDEAPDRSRLEFSSEQDFLRHAAKCLAILRKTLERPSDAGGDKKALAALERLRRERLAALEMRTTIAVARIDDESGERYHIGPGVVYDGNSPIVIDWRTPVAAPFWNASHDDPQGLRLRRRLRTKWDKLLGLEDEQFGAGVAPLPTTYDALLEELGRERTGSMSEIVATIQRDQYRMITLPEASTTVVQGGPGTGKTVVGLHRAALLLYRNREGAPDARILIVGPNPVFMQYIQYVLPSLGETSVDQFAVQALGNITIKGVDDPRVTKVKGGIAMAAVLRAAVMDRVRPPNDDIAFDDEEPRFTVARADVEGLIDGFDPSRQSYNDARDRFRDGFERLAASASGAASRSRRELVNVRARPEYNRAVDRVWPSITAEELLRQLLSSEERLERAAGSVLSDVDQRLLYRKPVESLEQVVWTAGDVGLVDEVRALLSGRPTTYWHVVLDEAQDLTPMELRMVGRRVRRGAVTVLGDLAQATGPWEYDEWHEIVGHLGVDHPVYEELTYAYRVPRQIMQAALPILAQTAPATTPPIPYRDGPSDPVWTEVPRAERASKAVSAASARQHEGGTVAIIAPARLLSELRHELDVSRIEYEDGQRGQIGRAIELLDPTFAKGLEFDHVVLVEPAVIVREHRDGLGRGLRELYVALTRPTRSLTCIHSERLPWPLGPGQSGV